jgi:tRNA 2-selenouridine synthase
VDTRIKDESKLSGEITLVRLAGFDEIIDVRSPGEFAEDHIPGSINLPVLDNEERAKVGTIYKQVSAFEAKKIGGALVYRNIAHHLEHAFADKPKNWRPLVYCWRGGSRSGAMVHLLNKVGWHAMQLDGGYKAYRRAVLDSLETLPPRYQYRTVCGLTGTGKSRLLNALEELGAQVLDLERLAAHRGSVLGSLPDIPQPPQKLFDSQLWAELQKFDPAQPVYVEAESKKIGNIRVPDALISAMWAGRCVHLESPLPLRLALIKEEYAHFANDVAKFNAKLAYLAGIHGAKHVEHWQNLASIGNWDSVFTELMEQHYDPSYAKALLKHYAQLNDGLILTCTDINPIGMRDLARFALAWN